MTNRAESSNPTNNDRQNGEIEDQAYESVENHENGGTEEQPYESVECDCAECQSSRPCKSEKKICRPESVHNYVIDNEENKTSETSYQNI